MIISHITKILEKAIKNKLEKNDSNFLRTTEYQTGFNAKKSTHKNLTIIINKIKGKDRKIIISLNI